MNHAFDRYLREDFERDDRLAIVMIARSEAGSTVRQQFRTAEEIAKPEFMAKLSAANMNRVDLYMGVNSLKPEATARTKADVANVRHLFLDFDDGGYDSVRKVLSASDMPKPTRVFESSPGRHQVLWAVSGYTPDKAEQTVRGMAHAYGGDASVWDSARILRIPGFRNWKRPEQEAWVRDMKLSDANRAPRVLTPADFPKFKDMELSPVFAQKAQRERTGAPGQRDMSASGVEGREVLRALGRGQSATEVQQWLVEKARERNKPSPERYAERTIQWARSIAGR